MTKYTFILHNDDRNRLLSTLASLGVVDTNIEHLELTDNLSQLILRIENYGSTLEKVKEFAKHNAKELRGMTKNVNKTHFHAADGTRDNTAISAFDTFVQQSIEIDNSKAKIAKYSKELEDVKIWGEFKIADFANLAAEELFIHFFMCSMARFEELSATEELNIESIAEKDKNIYFIVITNSGAMPEIDNVTPVRRPTMDAGELEDLINKEELEIKRHNKLCALCTNFIKDMEDYLRSLKYELSVEKVVHGASKCDESPVIVIEGWAPNESVKEIDAALERQQAIIYVKDAPTLEDNPPIKLKNNRFARMCELVSNLYALPRYHELDLTPFFAPFFVFFVGICFGDIGYGAIVLIGGTVARFFIKSKTAQPVLDLVMWCSIAAIIMGTITGNFCGMELAKMEAFKDIHFMGQMSLFSFSLVVGLIQIIYAMFVKVYAAIKFKGFKYAISTLGWVFTIIAGCLTMVIPDFKPSSPLFISIVSVCLLGNILFYNPEKNPLSNVGIGMWELYNNVTGLLGDVLSYIRLFALGLSSGIIASVFNELAVGMSPENPVTRYIVMILILAIGHGINIFMSMISSFVHPLRLTFVEFYKNAGFEGGGRLYDPLTDPNANIESEKK